MIEGDEEAIFKTQKLKKDKKGVRDFSKLSKKQELPAAKQV